MKPIKLELKEFGPYKSEIVDWNKIITQPMFLITGKTGAGKSTLFDAIVFALYNTTSGEKNVDNLRRKGAEEKSKTEVTFEFELKEKKYSIKRSLSYTKSGRKTKVELAELTPEVKIIATKEKEVKEYVEELLGLDSKQFCQIVILPQGQFKKFLLSKSSEKALILRSLFNTNLYQKFVEKMQEYVKELSTKYQLKEKEILSKFDQFKFNEEIEKSNFLQENIFDDVLKQITKQEEKDSIISEEYKKVEKEYKEIDEEYIHATKLNEKFLELDSFKEELKKLESSKEKIKATEKEIEKLRELEKNKNNISSYYELINKEKIEKTEKEKLLIKREEYTKGVLENEKLKQELEKSSKTIQDYRNYIEKNNYFYLNVDNFKKAENDEKQYELKIDQVKENKKKLEHDKQILEENIANKNDLEKKISNLEKEIYSNKLQISQKNLEVEQLKKYNKLEEDLKTKRKETDIQKNKLDKLYATKEKLESQNKEYEKNKNILLMDDLREHLHVGEDCPLCLQKIATTPLAKKETILLVSVKEELEQNIKDITEIETIIKRNKVDIKNLEDEYNDLHRNVNGSVQEELLQLKEANEETENNVETLKKELQNVEKTIKALKINEENLNNLTLKEQEYKEKYLEATTKLTQYKESIDLKISEFEKYFAKILQKVKDFDNSKEIYTKRENDLKIENIELVAKEKNNIEALKKIIDDKEKTVLYFNNSNLKKFYADIKIAGDNLLELEKLNTYLQEVEEYKNAEIVLNENISRLEKEISKKEKPNLENIKQERIIKGEVVEKIKEEKLLLEQDLLNNKKLYENIFKEYKDWTKKAENNREIVQLSNALSGKNEGKKSLETFVQGYYLDLILQAGSKRLLKMSEGRYSFERKTDVQRGNGLKGLEIDVYDINSNGSRDINSLSGGELFLASLSLALGLAEVIQQESGNISLETIFIDEGFGSLDSETLDIAISSLIELQSYGRNIGIISHVSELKERVKARMEIYSENDSAKVKILGV